MSRASFASLLAISYGVQETQAAQAKAALSFARQVQATAIARMVDECGMSFTEVAAALPGLSRQRAAQLAARGRRTLVLIDVSQQGRE